LSASGITIGDPIWKSAQILCQTLIEKSGPAAPTKFKKTLQNDFVVATYVPVASSKSDIIPGLVWGAGQGSIGPVRTLDSEGAEYIIGAKSDGGMRVTLLRVEIGNARFHSH
jgi:hypothetical protein